VELAIPNPSLVLLVGPSGAGKSTFARRHFAATEIISSDELRARVADDADDQEASADAFHVLGVLLNARLKRRRLTVVDATNLRAANRRRWVGIAHRYGIPAVAVVFDLRDEIYVAWNTARPGRRVEGEVVEDHIRRLRMALDSLPDEGFERLYVLRDPESVTAAVVIRLGPGER
jgi:protein phosphatase